MSELPILELAIVFALVVYLWETYLDTRQRSRLASKGGVVPSKLAALVKKLDEEALKALKKEPPKREAADKGEEKSEKKIEDGKMLEKMTSEAPKFQAYGLDKITFGMVKGLFGFCQEHGLVLLGMLPYMWDLASGLVGRLGYDPSESEIFVSLAFAGVYTVIETVLELPWSLYSTFVVEERHGFNKTTLSLFVTDLLTTTALTMAIGGPVLAILIKIIKWGGEYFYLYVWGFLFVFSIFFLTIFPIWIQPLFNKYEPLPEGELKGAIFSLAKDLKFPLTKLFVVDGSKRSSHSNAYLFGFFNNKRIVLFDTLIKQMTVPELKAVLGHEIGHWAHGHVMQMFVIQQAYFLVMFAVFGFSMNDAQLYLSFGFNPSTKPTIIGLILFMSTIWAPVDKALSFVLTLNTRRNEFQADEYATSLNYGPLLKTGLTKMSIENRSNLDPDPLYSLYHYSHPPLLQRLSAIDVGIKKKA